MNDEEYLGQMRDVIADWDRAEKTLTEKLSGGGIKTEKDLRLCGWTTVMLFNTGVRLERLREQNYKNALGEIGQIKDEATDDMNRLGQQGGGR